MQRLLIAFLMALIGTFPATGGPKGTLVIVGGGGMPREIQAAFFQASGGKGGVVGVITTSTSDPKGALKEWKADLEAAGLTCVPLDVRTRADASRPETLAAARRCTGFWFTGGDQNRVGDAIVGTPLQALVRERYEAGAGVGGTSAGAAIMSRIMLTGDDRHGKEALSEFGVGAYQTREGMGFLPPGILIDQHFLRRSRQNRLFSLVMAHPDHLGLGIDEATALVVTEGVATVVGERSVMVFDPAGMKGQGDSFRDLRIHVLRAGQTLELSSRQVRP